ncbi:MAG: hypothetical protein ACQERJ_04295 [Bacillota bacterium]
MVKITKQFFDLIDPQTKETSSGIVIQLELESETKKFIDFYSFLNQFSKSHNVFKKNMKRKQTVNMKVAKKQAEKMIASYLKNDEFTEI